MSQLPESVLIRMGIDVASALGFAHREGVVHRDIKVDNILFDEHGNAIVADFGIARAVSNYVQQTGTNMVVGTPQYFSPEQARGQPLDGRADIYSLGVTLYRAAAGVLPFTGDDWYEIARQHVEDGRSGHASTIRSSRAIVERVILRCLEKDPAARYPDRRGAVPGARSAQLGAQRHDRHAERRGARILGNADGPDHHGDRPAPETATPSARWCPSGACPLGARRRAPGREARMVWLSPHTDLGATGREWERRSPGPSGSVPGTVTTRALGDTRSAEAGRGAVAQAGTRSSDGTGGSSGVHHGSTHPLAAADSTAVNTPGLPTTDGTTAATPPPDKDRGFGTVHLDTRPAGTLYTFQALDDGHVVRGRTPAQRPAHTPRRHLRGRDLGPLLRLLPRHRSQSRPKQAAPPLKVTLVCAGRS